MTHCSFPTLCNSLFIWSMVHSRITFQLFKTTFKASTCCAVYYYALVTIRVTDLCGYLQWKVRSTGYLENTDTGQRGHEHVKNTKKKQSKRKMRKKSYHPFYKVTILCEIIFRVRVTVRVSMLSVSVLYVFSR